METAIRTSGSFVRTEYGVMVECLKCGHVGFLVPKHCRVRAFTPIAAFIKRLRCRRCGSQSVLATQQGSAREGLLVACSASPLQTGRAYLCAQPLRRYSCEKRRDWGRVAGGRQLRRPL
jgi:hypothetical protein